MDRGTRLVLVLCIAVVLVFLLSAGVLYDPGLLLAPRSVTSPVLLLVVAGCSLIFFLPFAFFLERRMELYLSFRRDWHLVFDPVRNRVFRVGVWRMVDPRDPNHEHTFNQEDRLSERDRSLSKNRTQ
jgi:hypothetical protein